ncbi:MAG TPA: hypothetical protein VIJ51_04350 [Solirubrobacteraceae bacterium]
MERTETQLTTGAKRGVYGHNLTAEEILKGLALDAASLDRGRVAAAPGVYAWFLADGATLGQVSNPAGGPVYVGVTGNLAEREFETHFAAGKTGFSTLRRSLGAILKAQLDLRGRPRGTGASKTNYTNYKFDDGGEQRLSAWMHKNLRVGTRALEHPQVREPELIILACPPLNLTGWANPEAATIRELRKACADEAQLERR